MMADSTAANAILVGICNDQNTSQLADQALQQLQQLVVVAKDIFKQLALPHAKTDQSPSDRLEDLQQSYIQLSAALKDSVNKCHRQQQDELAQLGAAENQQGDQGDAAEISRLQQRVQELKCQATAKSDALKPVIDTLRQLMDALTMWENYEKQLLVLQQAAER